MEYIAIRVTSGEVFISTRRAALNMAYQGFTAEFGKVEPVLTLKGQVGVSFFSVVTLVDWSLPVCRISWVSL